MKDLFALVLASSLALTGCNGSSSSSSTVDIASLPVIEAHHIQPNAVNEYVERYKAQSEHLALDFNGTRYSISLNDMDTENKLLIANYNLGIAVIGFDFDKEKPIAQLGLIEGDFSDPENVNEAELRNLIGQNITVESDGDDNYVYTGTVSDSQSGEQYDVRLVINESLISGGSSELVVDGTSVTLTGDLGTQTYVQIQDMLDASPEVNTLIIKAVNGSVNDAINMHTGRLVRNAQLTTKIPADGFAYSGGVDLFAAGYQRVYEAGGKVGVHSWCCEAGKPANELKKDDPAHRAQLTFFREMMGLAKGPEFYFFTIDAAPFDDVHLMTLEEMTRYGLLTE